MLLSLQSSVTGTSICQLIFHKSTVPKTKIHKVSYYSCNKVVGGRKRRVNTLKTSTDDQF